MEANVVRVFSENTSSDMPRTDTELNCSDKLSLQAVHIVRQAEKLLINGRFYGDMSFRSAAM